MFPKIIHFIKYHNAFTICFMLVFIGFSISFAASPDFRKNFISSQETVRSVDNTMVINANLDDFAFSLKIQSVKEDEKNYYIAYTFQTLAVKDYIWQKAEKETTLTVSKEALRGKDLGLYVAEELGEVIDYEISYLKEVQQLEKEKGLTQKIVATQYVGLIGSFLDPEEKIFEGYQPVVQAPEPPAEPPAEPSTSTSTLVQEEPTPQEIIQVIEKPVNEEQIRRIILEMLSQYKIESSLAPIPEPIPEPTPEPSEVPESTTAVDSPEVTTTPESQPEAGLAPETDTAPPAETSTPETNTATTTAP